MVAIGVTGHRVLAEQGKLEAGLDDVASRIAAGFPGEPWTVISALAEGADRLVARRLLAGPATRLVAVLPLAAGDYEANFSAAPSRQEFRALLDGADEVIEVVPATSQDAAYEAAGREVLDRADVLVAVWDGQGAQGQGGTAAIVAQARARGLPLAWVHAGNRKPGTLEPTSLGAEQGAVTFERLPEGGRGGERPWLPEFVSPRSRSPGCAGGTANPAQAS